MNPFHIRAITEGDKPWISRTLTARWGSPLIITRGFAHHANLLPGFIALYRGSPAGLLTYHVKADQCEIVTLDSLVTGIGIGKALLETAAQTALTLGCQRLWLITTNDNTSAIRYYQRQGFHFAAIYPNAIQKYRILKPGIPEVGIDEIPIRDEIEFEKRLPE